MTDQELRDLVANLAISITRLEKSQEENLALDKKIKRQKYANRISLQKLSLERFLTRQLS